MRLPSFCLLAFLACRSLALPSPASSHRLVHERRLVALESAQHKPAESDTIVTLRIALKHNNLELGDRHLNDISHPASPRYGQHWTAQHVQELFAPSPTARQTVIDWLAEAGIRDVHYRHGRLAADVRVSDLEELLNTKYFEYPSDSWEDGSVQVGCNEYRLPQHVSEYVDYIWPGVASPVVNTKSRSIHSKRDAATDNTIGTWVELGLGNFLSLLGFNELLPVRCKTYTTPDCLRALYQLPTPEEVAGNFSANSSASTVAVFEAERYYNQSDLDTWYEKYASYIPAGAHPLLQSVDGGAVNQSIDVAERVEADVDITMLYSLLYPKQLDLVQVAGDAFQQVNADTGLAVATENFLDALNGTFCTEQEKDQGLNCSTISLSKVTSISFDTGELYLTEAQQQRQCAEFMQLALQGYTFVVSSGDWGVANNWNENPDGVLTNGCGVAGDVNATLNHLSNGTIFNPQFPANCPYILSVGATMLPQNGLLAAAETVMQQPLDLAAALAKEGVQAMYPTTTSSSGGFSNFFDRPSYQDQALASYFRDHNPPYPSYNVTDNGTTGSIGANGGLYNRAGRGIPDVSANGANFPGYAGGYSAPIWGTSIAAPIWAAILTLVNERRSSVGKGSVGFVQPVLYAHPEVFQDITGGNNPGCGTEGFEAVPGWDRLGTPNFPKLLDLFMSLP